MLCVKRSAVTMVLNVATIVCLAAVQFMPCMAVPPSPFAPLPASATHRGIVFGGGEWSDPRFRLDGSASDVSIQALAETGATHIRILVTWYQDSIDSTSVYANNNASSPLRTPSVNEVKHAIQTAKSFKLSVTLAPILDPNWDDPKNARDSRAPNFVWRGQIGKSFSKSDWDAWFTSYTQFITTYAQLAQDTGVDLFEVASELDAAFDEEDHFRDLIGNVRKVFSGKLTLAAGDPDKVKFWDVLDYIGNDAYSGKGSPANNSVAAMQEAWRPHIDMLKSLSDKYSKQVLITEIGFQSRPSCACSGANCLRYDQNDCSGWLECYDMDCQANAYEALFRAFSEASQTGGQNNTGWWEGVYFWLWHTDPTSGGTSDASFTPRGKPAETVLRNWYGGDYVLYTRLGSRRPKAPSVADAVQEATATSVKHATAFGESVKRTRAVSGYRNGFVFGGPDEWSYPGYRYDSQGAFSSLKTMSKTGANSVEIMVMNYYDNNNSTEFYPITDLKSTLRTSTDDELAAIIGYAQSLGLSVCLTPMLDPNYDLPGNCRQCKSPPGPGWRGTIGQYWGDDCSPGSPWARWHENYRRWMVHYASFAQDQSVDIFLVAHELETATHHCPDLWKALLDDVTAVFQGNVSAAFNGPFIDSYQQVPWASQLNWIGVDCYYAHNVNVSTLPWQDADQSAIKQAWQPYLDKFANASKYFGGKDIVCTEVGFQSRPWSYSSTLRSEVYAPGHQLCSEDCSVWDQCYSTHAQYLAYDSMLTVLYEQDWFGGIYLWMWRADPTSGGPSDDSFTPAGKDAIEVVTRFWRP